MYDPENQVYSRESHLNSISPGPSSAPAKTSPTSQESSNSLMIILPVYLDNNGIIQPAYLCATVPPLMWQRYIVSVPEVWYAW